MWKQGVAGQVFVVAVSIVFGLGLVILSVGYVCLAWWLVMTHGFGFQALDVWSGVGVVLALLPVIGLVVLTRGRE